MAWDPLPTDYTNAVWDGLKKYNQVQNSDGSVSFEDVTEYSERENSFFGAKDANQMNGAINTIMGALEDEAESNHLEVTIGVSDWLASSNGYSYSIAVEGVSDGTLATMGIIYPSDCTRATQKAISKAAGYLYEAEFTDGLLTVRATLKPTVDLTLGFLFLTYKLVNYVD